MSTSDPMDDLSESLVLDSVPSPAVHREPLGSRSFMCLMAVQFLTVLNDNAFRWLVVPLAKHKLSPGAALSLGLAGFTLPFIFLATPSGYLADRFSKTKVIRYCKIAEIIIMLLGLAAIISGQTSLLFFVVVLTGAMAALFSPSKSGSIPELVEESQLSRANGLMGLMTVVPAAIGFLLGKLLAGLALPEGAADVTTASILPAAATIMGIAVVGWLASYGIHYMPAADTTRKFPWNPFAETVASLKLLGSDRPLLRASLGIAFFWILASLAQMNVDQLGQQELKMPELRIGVLGMMLVLGVGGGSVLAGRWSGGHVELGIVPLGAIGVVIWSMLLCLSGWWGHTSPDYAFYASCISLCCLGASAGLF
ncbi:MAG TPA: MFS transporter, partial [Schlesneria sp.]